MYVVGIQVKPDTLSSFGQKIQSKENQTTYCNPGENKDSMLQVIVDSKESNFMEGKTNMRHSCMEQEQKHQD